MRRASGSDNDAVHRALTVVEMVARPAQEEAADTLPLGVASSRPDPRLGRDELESSLKILSEGKRGCLTVGSPPRRRPPNLRRGAGRRLDGEACGHRLLAKFSEEGLCVDELTPRGLIEGLFKGSLLIGG